MELREALMELGLGEERSGWVTVARTWQKGKTYASTSTASRKSALSVILSQRVDAMMQMSDTALLISTDRQDLMILSLKRNKLNEWDLNVHLWGIGYVRIQLTADHYPVMCLSFYPSLPSGRWPFLCTLERRECFQEVEMFLLPNVCILRSSNIRAFKTSRRSLILAN
jgi:hypothetical protein